MGSTDQPEHIAVQHILIGFRDAVGFRGSSPASARSRNEADAKKLAHELLEKARRGADFDHLVTQYTDDSPPGIYKMSNTGVKPSEADEYPRQGMVAAFGNVGFALDVNEVGMADYDPTTMTSPYGWHIIKRVK